MSIYFFIFIFVPFVWFCVLFLCKYFYNRKCVAFLYCSIKTNFLFFVSYMASSSGKRKSTRPRALTDEDLQNFLEKKEAKLHYLKGYLSNDVSLFSKNFLFLPSLKKTGANRTKKYFLFKTNHILKSTHFYV